MQARKVKTVNLNACYVGQMGMHQGKLSFKQNSAAQTLARLDLQILQTLRSLRSTINTYKHTIRINKKQSPNSTNSTKEWHKTNLCFETIVWT
jgi:hypothetical protein